MGERTRQEQRPEDCWAIEDLYAADTEWEADFQKLSEELKGFSKYQGKLTENGSTLLHALKELDDLKCRFEKVYVYANQRYHEDTGNSHYQGLSARASRLEMELEQAASFVEPELMELSEDTLDTLIGEEAGLELYRRMLSEILRMKPHILSKEMEEVLARTGEMAQAPKNIFSMFQNADLRFGKITVDGKEMELTQGNFVRCLENKDRKVREQAFKQFYAKYREFQNTLAAAYNGNLAQDIFYAKVRGYASCMEMALDGGNIPTDVYTRLIEAVHSKLPAMYRYVKLRKKALGLEELHMYDVYVPIVESVEREIPFEEAKQMVKEGLQVLGEDYIALLEEGFSNRWIDIYENQGKRGGAYSWGAYGTHPYVLLNYQGNLDNVFTLAHEMGHALHSYHSDQAQPFTYAGYRIFVAEVASTCNEALLINHMLKNAKDDKEKAYLLNHFLDQFKGTVYRQTMFAEFEMLAHEKAERGEGITAQVLEDLYYDLNCKYFGEEMVSDPEIAMEWARIPHFYTPFYVYQYATGFAAAIAISNKILSGESGIIDAYKKFLSGGSSMDCIDLLKICGVDMTKKQPVEAALEVFEKTVGELEALLSV
ncbi:MAG: oligoendopeptidase F [Clostridiales bacterium]|nr:oligoendopeptidase F [Clostridiales bacterium]